MDNSSQGKFQITKGKPSLRLQEIIMDSDGLLTLVKLNLLFIITTIPFLPVVMLFTGGASITALLYCTNQLVRTGTVSEVKNTYFNVFKTYFRKTFTAGLVVVLLNILFVGGLMFYITMASSNIIYIPFASVSLLAIIIIQAIAIHLFPAFAEEENKHKSAKELVSKAATDALSKMKETMIAVVISVLVIAGIISMLPKTLPLLVVMIFSVPALAAGFAHSDAEFISDII